MLRYGDENSPYGPPNIGKSTVIACVIGQYGGPKSGIVARELLNSTGERIGFTSVNEAGQSRQFMFGTKTPGPESIGGLFDVDIAAVDDFVVAELREGLQKGADGRLMYIDEIGRAQAKSQAFLAILQEIMRSDCSILGSIVYDDEPWSLEFKRDERLCLIEVTTKNRNELPDILLRAYAYEDDFRKLKYAQQKLVYDFLRELIASGQFISARKLFDNALGYVNGKKISPIKSGSYSVEGITRAHNITRTQDGFTCDCDLANGCGSFVGTPGLCSHEMAIRLQDLA